MYFHSLIAYTNFIDYMYPLFAGQNTITSHYDMVPYDMLFQVAIMNTKTEIRL